MGSPYLTHLQNNFASVPNTTNVTVAYSSNTTAGSLLLALCSSNVSASNITGVSDSVNGAWTPIGTSQANGAGTGFFQSYFFNGSAGGVTPSVTGFTSGQVLNLLILEFIGQKVGAGVLDTSVYSTTGLSSGPFTGSLTTNFGNEAVIALLMTGTASNWTLGGTPTPTGIITAALQRQAAITQLGSPGSASVSYTPDRQNAWTGLLWAAFRSNQVGVPNSLMLVGAGT